MTNRTRSLTICLIALAFVCLAGPAVAQDKAAPSEKGLVSFIPPEAFLYVEHSGHDAILSAFLDSNLGEIMKDEAMLAFVNDTRVKSGKLIVKELFALGSDEEIAKHQEILHKMLKPFWYKPAALFLVPTDGKFECPPGAGFLCAIDEKSRAECKSAVETLTKIGVPAAGKAGTRQAFTYKTGTLQWDGVAKGGEEFSLPTDAAKQVETLKTKTLFMVCWTDSFLLVATNLSAADAMGKVMAGPDKAKDKNESLQKIAGKTALKDWAFRWFIDVELIKKTAFQGRQASELAMDESQRIMRLLGVNNVRGIGGCGGYADKVFTRLTYIDSPGPHGGLMAVLKKGGSYKDSLAVMPSDSTFLLAGQLDTKALSRLVREVAIQSASAQAGYHTDPSNPASSQPEVKLSEENEKIVKQIEELAACADGNAGGFVTDLQAFMGMMMGGGAGMPAAVVFGIKDQERAAKVIAQWTGATPASAPDDGASHPPAGTAGTAYRKVPIQRLGSADSPVSPRFAVMKDRVIVALGDNAVKSAIDVALDKTGGFEPEGKASKLAKVAGDGPAIFMMDVSALAKLMWPFLMQGVEAAESHGMMFPLASLPSTDKLVKFVGPEIAVFEPDDGGMLLKSRGKIPFITKIFAGYPLMVGGMMGIFSHHSTVEVAPPPPMAVPPVDP